MLLLKQFLCCSKTRGFGSISVHYFENVIFRKIQHITPIVSSRSKYTKKDVANTEKLYEGPLHTKLRFIKVFSLTTSVAAIPLQYILMNNYKTTESIYWVIFFGTLTFFQITSPLLVHLIGSKYVVRMHYDTKNEKYIAVTYSLFGMEKFHEFTPDDVKIPTVGMFTTAIIKNKPMFFDPEEFSSLEHYKKILGYDKPIKLFEEGKK